MPGGDAGAPRRPGLSGAIKGAASPARDWPHRPVLPADPHHLLLPSVTAGSVSSPALRRSGARARCGSRTIFTLGGHRWDRAQGGVVNPHMVVPIPTGSAQGVPRCSLPPAVPRATLRPSFASPVEVPPASGTLPTLPYALQNHPSVPVGGPV